MCWITVIFFYFQNILNLNTFSCNQNGYKRRPFKPPLYFFHCTPPFQPLNLLNLSKGLETGETTKSLEYGRVTFPCQRYSPPSYNHHHDDPATHAAETRYNHFCDQITDIHSNLPTFEVQIEPSKRVQKCLETGETTKSTII